MATVHHQIGKTRIILHSKSDVILMTSDEQREWFQKELDEGNPQATRIRDAVQRILYNSLDQEMGA